MATTKIGQVSILPCGAFSLGTHYERLSVVTYNGSSYIAKVENTNKPITDTTVWYLLASKGDKGDTYEVTPEDLQAIADQITSDASSAFNVHVTEKTTEFDNHVTSKTGDFDTNASNKTTTFNNNASAKVEYYNQNAEATIEGNVMNLDQIPKKLVEDTAINVTDSSNLLLADIQIKGNASQTTTSIAGGDEYDSPTPDHPQPISVVTGSNIVTICEKNLFDATFEETTKNGITFSADNEYINVNGNANPSFIYNSTTIKTLPAGDYIFMVELADGTITGTSSTNLYINNVTTNTNIIGAIVLGENFARNAKTFHLDAPTKIRFRTYWSNADTFTNVKLKYQIVSGTVPDYDFEPYTEQSQIISLGVVNLFNAEEVTTDDGHFRASDGAVSVFADIGYTTSYIAVKPDTAYTLSGNICNTGSFGRIYYLDSNKDWISRTGGYNGNITFTTPNNCYYIQFQYKLDFVDFSTIQLEEGYIASPYCPYGATPMELAKIGDYQDYIYKSEGKWYKYGAVGKYSYNNDLSTNGLTDDQVQFLTPALNVAPNSATADLAFCNLLTSTLVNKTGLGGATGTSKIRIMVSTTYGTTYEAIRTIFSQNNLTIYYQQLTPTITEITDTTLIGQLDNLLALKTNRTTTNMFTVTDNETPTLAVLYRQDLTTLFNNLTSAILSLGNNT